MIPAKADAMNAGVELQGINVRKKRVEEVDPEAGTLLLVEPAAFRQIPFGLVENANAHED